MKSVSKTINDNNRERRSVDTLSLDRTAKNRIIAKRLEAQCKLQDDVTGFLTVMKANAEPLLGVIPFLKICFLIFWNLRNWLLMQRCRNCYLSQTPFKRNFAF